MGELSAYSLTVSAIILVLFPVMHQTVNHSTSFRFNRAVMLCGLALSLILPWAFSAGFITSLPDEAMADAGLSLTAVNHFAAEPSAPEASATGIPWMAIAVTVYFSGIAILICREVISFLRLFRIIAKSEKRTTDGVTICCLTDETTAPFSWGNYIFLHDSEFNDTDCIYIHEKAHADRWHWIDVLFADLFCILLWYNPFAWMTRKLMRLNHEFEADEAVISSGVDTCDYQRLLVVKAMKMRVIPVTDSFAADRRSFSKRVLIMSKKRSSRKPMLIALCAIPAIALAGTALSMPYSSQLLSSISDYSIGRGLLSTEELSGSTPQDFSIEPEAPEAESDSLTVIPSPFEDQTALAEIIRLSVETIQPDKDTKVNITIVVDEDGRVKDVSSDNHDGAAVAAAISQKFNGVRLEQITDNGRPVEVRLIVPVLLKKKE